MRIVVEEHEYWETGEGPSFPRGSLLHAEVRDEAASSSSSHSQQSDSAVDKSQATVHSQQAMMEQMQR